MTTTIHHANPYPQEPNTVLADGTVGDVRILVLRGPFSPCAYVGVQKDSPRLQGIDHEEIELDVHGGITYRGLLDVILPAEAHFWWGWDYAHHGDHTVHSTGHFAGRRWATKTIARMAEKAAAQLHELLATRHAALNN
ncbi:MAG: hypothetical protein AAGI68_14185 [Planctomycetota bacterium]